MVIDWIVRIINYAIQIYMLAIVIDALLTWFPGASQSRFGQFLGRIVNPFLEYFNFAHIGMLGFGPILALIVLQLLQFGVTYIGNIIISLVG
ncbi:YggT family protein [Fructilactobacillus fructivorans]|uniref:Cell division membrane protein n=1 Tax=Fructilactobacillus fructivorans TaxID=1614 RepID=A0A0C1M528_9LACO|nr:YggT family protein [Fructilactobacillus fructivorans]KID41299.1 Cell division membrane protein [Fructilactobacillus fructivorans]KRK58819.1 cell division membrane protein [Fructilactobacillus fructivorans]KRN39568.1 cell division membrane protein [Fructilactobacillus fructivorans]KRN43287.1 cell division membrane protein [Fructilactobacillus fructivorans]MCT0152098.1 YggT family protein [Fructilactobacillus fructivorans]